MKLNHSQITFAREYRGMNQSELSDKIQGLSQSNLSKFEKGFDVLSDDKIEEIIRTLKFPKSFFKKKIYNDVLLAHYRIKSGVNKSVRTKLNSNNKIIAYLVDQLNESVDFPDFNFTPLNPEDYTPEQIAKHTRNFLGLKKDEPVKNIFHLLENNGIVVVELDEPEQKFDGVSIKTDNGNALIIINKHFSNDRKRFTLAHELGHTLMHNMGNFPEQNYRTQAEKENEANRFAAEFLMPAEVVQHQLRGMNLYDLAPLKKYWYTSKAALIKRAKDLKCIPENRARYFMIELSRMGERKVEKTLVSIDKPVLYRKAYDMHINTLNYTNEDLANAFSLPKDIIEKFFVFSEKGKLRIII